MSEGANLKFQDDTVYPDISIIVPTLNAESTIDRFFEGIKKQTYKGKIEIIMIDGGSTDHTLEIGNRNNAIIRILRGSDPYTAMTYGLKLASSLYIWHLDSDNYIENEHFAEELIKPLLFDSSIITSTPMVTSSKNFNIFLKFLTLCERYNQEQIIKLSEKILNFYVIDRLPYAFPNASIVRKCAIEKIGGFYNDFLIEDALNNLNLGKTAICSELNYIHDQKISIIGYIKKWRKRISVYANESWTFRSLINISNDSNLNNQYNGELFTNTLFHPIRTLYISAVQFSKTKNTGWLIGWLIPLTITLILISTPLNSFKVIKKILK